MGWRTILLLCALFIFAGGCAKKSGGSPTAPTTSSTLGAVRCMSANQANWTLYNASSTPATVVGTSTSSDAVFPNLTPGTYEVNYVEGGTAYLSSPFPVTAAKTTTVTVGGSGLLVSDPS